MHGAVVTAFGGGGHVFFEDISLNPFKDTLSVPFSEYRCNNQSHVILQLVYIIRIKEPMIGHVIFLSYSVKDISAHVSLQVIFRMSLSMIQLIHHMH